MNAKQCGVINGAVHVHVPVFGTTPQTVGAKLACAPCSRLVAEMRGGYYSGVTLNLGKIYEKLENGTKKTYRSIVCDEMYTSLSSPEEGVQR